MQRGFTLIEILIVVAVIAIAVGVAVLSLGNRDDSAALEREAQRIALTIELARERAERESVEWGLDLLSDRYRFLRYDETKREWQATIDPPFTDHLIAEGVQLDLQVDQQKLASERRSAKERPEILVLSSGETSAFDLVFTSTRDNELRWLLSCDGFNAPELRKLDANEPVRARG